MVVITSQFVVRDIEHVAGRGTILIGDVTGLVQNGMELVDNHRHVRIRGVERHLIHGEDLRTDTRPIGLLVPGDVEDYEIGVIWGVVTPAQTNPASPNHPDHEEWYSLIEAERSLSTALRSVRRRLDRLQPERRDPGEHPRIALRPDVRGENPMSHMTRLDDIYVRDVPMFRAEQMGPDNWWVCCYLSPPGEGHDRICWSVFVDDDGQIRWVTTEFPDEGITYEAQ